MSSNTFENVYKSRLSYIMMPEHISVKNGININNAFKTKKTDTNLVV